MSTRAVFTFTDDDGSYSVYKHHDGYPQGEYGALVAINRATILSWPLPRFEADEFACAFIAANKPKQGDMRLTSSPEEHGDLEYTYEVSCRDRELWVTCCDYNGNTLFDTTLANALTSQSVIQ